MRRRLNRARPARFRVGDVKRECRRNPDRTQERNLVRNGQIGHMDRQSVTSDHNSVVWDLDNPEHTVCRDPWIKIMDLRPRTGVEEVQSYLHERAVRTRGD